MHQRAQYRHAVIACAAAFAMACGSSGPTAPTSDSPAREVEVGVAGGGEAVLAPGAPLQLWARTKNKDGSTTDVTNVAVWQASDLSIATVSSGGLVRATKAGAVTVSASFAKLSASLPLTVISCIATVPPRFVFTANGGFATLPVTLSQSDCRWSAVSSDSSWLSVFVPQAVSGTGNVNYQVAVNNSAEPRTGTIRIDVPDGRGAAVAIVQDKPSCSFVLSPPARTVPAAGGAFSFDLVTSPATCQWRVTAFEGGNLKLTGPRSGSGNATIGYTLAANTLAFSPTYSIEVSAILNDSPPARHTVTQLR